MEAWTIGVLPLRRGFGFDVEAWISAAESRSVWLLRFGGPGTIADADRSYYESSERRRLDPDPAQWIVGNETFALTELETGSQTRPVRSGR